MFVLFVDKDHGVYTECYFVMFVRVSFVICAF
jgi:hypothetical protein